MDAIKEAMIADDDGRSAKANRPIAEEIEFWRQQSETAPSKESALVAFGAVVGLTHIKEQSMALKAELMKCPFCGSPGISTVKDFSPLGLRYGAACSKCDCWCDFRCKTEEEAAERWNTRSIPNTR